MYVCIICKLKTVCCYSKFHTTERTILRQQESPPNGMKLTGTTNSFKFINYKQLYYSKYQAL